ncbi:MAG: NAD-dependent epimerase/dehydratase family protein [bacterium]
MNVLVTGATGFVGSYITKELLTRGYNVCGITQRGVTNYIDDISSHPCFHLVQHDLSEEFDLPDNFHALINAAAESRDNMAGFENYLSRNIIGTRNIINFCIKKSIKKVIHLSSMSIYGKVYDDIVTEKTESISPGNYGLSKLFAERMFKEENENIAAICLRLPGILGKEAKYPWLVQVLKALVAKKPIVVYNPDALFNNALYVKNLAYFTADLVTMDLHAFDVINISAQSPLKIIDVIYHLSTALKLSPHIDISCEKRHSFIISTQRAEKYYHYTPEALRDTLNRFTEDYCTHKG